MQKGKIAKNILIILFLKINNQYTRFISIN